MDTLICDDCNDMLNNFTALLLCWKRQRTSRHTWEREETYTRRQKCSEITEQFGLNELPLFAIAPTRWQYNNVHPFASTFVSFRLPFLDCNFEFAWVYSFQVCLQPQLDPFLRINDSNVWPERRNTHTKTIRRINVQKICANERIFALHFDI